MFSVSTENIYDTMDTQWCLDIFPGTVSTEKI